MTWTQHVKHTTEVENDLWNTQQHTNLLNLTSDWQFEHLITLWIDSPTSVAAGFPENTFNSRLPQTSADSTELWPKRLNTILSKEINIVELEGNRCVCVWRFEGAQYQQKSSKKHLKTELLWRYRREIWKSAWWSKQHSLCINNW
jgi:hypothetical protein